MITSKQGSRITISVDELSGKLLKLIELRKDDEVSTISTIKAVEE